MQTFVFAALFAASSFLSVSGQTYPPFNVSDVPEAVRTQWCIAQTTACPLLCEDQGKTASKNTCFPDNLYYVCLCSDGSAPDLEHYSQTIPYFRCQAEVRLCQDACTGNAQCQTDCVEHRPCGATNPPRLNVTSTSSTMTSTKTGGSTTGLSGTDTGEGFAATGTSGSGSGGTGNGAGSLLLELGNVYGLGLFAAGIAVGAAMIGA